MLHQPHIDVNKPQAELATPFFNACQEGHVRIVKLLLEDGRADPNLAMDTSSTPFFMACQEGHEEIVSMLLQDERVEVTEMEANGCSPFSQASWRRRMRICQSILIRIFD